MRFLNKMCFEISRYIRLELNNANIIASITKVT